MEWSWFLLMVLGVITGWFIGQTLRLIAAAIKYLQISTEYRRARLEWFRLVNRNR